MKLKIKNQQREFIERMAPEEFIEENIDNLEDLYAEEYNTTSEAVHNMQINFWADYQTTVIEKMVECYEAFILQQY